jgi:glycosyltransferase involved in cell wall biosynthesis
VDYVSGAVLLIRNDLFKECGRFDLKYKPAYFEDVDLAFKVRAKGLRVFYEPESVVFHVEGVSNGVDLNVGIKKYQVANQALFAKKWEKELIFQPPHRFRELPFPIQKDSIRNVLFVENSIFTPDRDTGSLRYWEIAKLLLDQMWSVTIAVENENLNGRYVAEARRAGVEVIGVSHIAERYRSRHPEIVILCRYEEADLWIEKARSIFPHSVVIYDACDLTYVRLARQAKILKNSELIRIAKRTESRELEICRKADVITTISRDEKQTLENQRISTQIQVIPTMYSDYGQPTLTRHDRNSIVFVGNFNHEPNIDAVNWFLREVWTKIPLDIRSEHPFSIVGQNQPASWSQKKSDFVHSLGWVPDISKVYNGAILSVAPIRYGAGIKGKISESMIYGVPVVTTMIGAEGMDLVDGENSLVTDSPEEFAFFVEKLISDESLWNKISTSAREHASKNFAGEKFQEAALFYASLLKSEVRL